jgi:hypothetical protein
MDMAQTYPSRADDEDDEKPSRKGPSYVTVEWIQSEVTAYTDASLNAKSLLRSGRAFTRMLTMLLKKHDYVNFFTEWSPTFTRTIRWLGLWRGILIGLFIDTLFFGIYFPDKGQCTLYDAEQLCIQTTSSFSSTGTLCTWNPENESCNLSPPPQDITFVLILALICMIIAAPLDTLLAYFLEETASKWPRLENIGLSTTYWLGSDRIGATDSTTSTTLTGLGEVSKAARLVTTEETKALATLAYDDLRPVKEEVEEIMHKIYRVNCIDLEAPAWQFDSGGLNDDKAVRATAILDTLGIYPNGIPAPLSVWDRLFYSDSIAKLEHTIETVRNRVQELSDRLIDIEETDAAARDYFMIQSFILEQFPPFKRFALGKQFYSYKSVSPGYVDIFEYVFAWSVVIMSNMFFIYWAFAWGVTNAGVTLQAWGLNFGIGVMQDVLFQNPMRICILYVLAVELMRPQLQTIHRTLYAVAMRCTTSVNHNFDFRVAQFTSAACRVARTPVAYDLPSAGLLRLINDTDVRSCKNPDRSNIKFILIAIIAVPCILAVVGDAAGEQLLDVAISSFAAAFLLFFSFLATYGIIFVAVPLVAGVAYLLYYYKVLTPAKKAIALRKGRIRSQTSLSRREQWNTFRISHKLYSRFKNFMVSVIVFLSNPVGYFRERQRARAARSNRTWLFMNSSRNPQHIFVDEGAISSVSTDAVALPEQIKYMSQRARELSSTHTVDNLQAHIDGFKPEVFKAGHVMRHELAYYRETVTTNNIDAALERMLGDLHKFEENCDWRDEYYMNEHADKYSLGVYIVELEPFFSAVWAYFYPYGFKLSPLEQLAAKGMFTDWTVREQETSNVNGAVSVLRFCEWFGRLCEFIRRMKSVQVNLQAEVPGVSDSDDQLVDKYIRKLMRGYSSEVGGVLGRNDSSSTDSMEEFEEFGMYFRHYKDTESSSDSSNEDNSKHRNFYGHGVGKSAKMDEFGFDALYDVNEGSVYSTGSTFADLQRQFNTNNNMSIYSQASSKHDSFRWLEGVNPIAGNDIVEDTSRQQRPNRLNASQESILTDVSFYNFQKQFNNSFHESNPSNKIRRAGPVRFVAASDSSDFTGDDVNYPALEQTEQQIIGSNPFAGSTSARAAIGARAAHRAAPPRPPPLSARTELTAGAVSSNESSGDSDLSEMERIYRHESSNMLLTQPSSSSIVSAAMKSGRSRLTPIDTDVGSVSSDSSFDVAFNELRDQLNVPTASSSRSTKERASGIDVEMSRRAVAAARAGAAAGPTPPAPAPTSQIFSLSRTLSSVASADLSFMIQQFFTGSDSQADSTDRTAGTNVASVARAVTVPSAPPRPAPVRDAIAAASASRNQQVTRSSRNRTSASSDASTAGSEESADVLELMHVFEAPANSSASPQRSVAGGSASVMAFSNPMTLARQRMPQAQVSGTQLASSANADTARTQESENEGFDLNSWINQDMDT